MQSNRAQKFRGCLCCSAPSAARMLRRKFLAGFAAAGLGAVISGTSNRVARADTARRLIDVHSHIVPPFYLAENRERIAGSRGGEISRAWLEWTPQQTLAAMNEHGVETAILSLSTPGVWFGNVDETRATARRVNEFGAGLVRDHPGRFGLFAALPLPDTEGSLRDRAWGNCRHHAANRPVGSRPGGDRPRQCADAAAAAQGRLARHAVCARLLACPSAVAINDWGISSSVGRIRA